MFQIVSGVIRNLNIKNANIAEYLTSRRRFGLIAFQLSNGLIDNCMAEGNLTSIQGTGNIEFAIFTQAMSDISVVSNCINNMDANASDFSSGEQTYASGIVFYPYSGTLRIINCINNGNITSAARTAGIVSFVQATLFLENNLNTGTIKSTSTSSSVESSAGGIISNLSLGTVTLKNNINLGNIENNGTGTNAGAGGIIGRANATSFLHNNTNSGNITANSTTEGNAGGLIGYAGGATSLFGNINTGTVESKGVYAGGAIGRANESSTITLDGNLNYGKIISTEVAGGMIGGWLTTSPPR